MRTPGGPSPEDPATRADARSLQALLAAALQAESVEVRDDGHLHVGHAGAREGGHYAARIVSTRFEGLTRVARHRLVYDALGPLAQRGIHALAIEALAPSECRATPH